MTDDIAQKDQTHKKKMQKQTNVRQKETDMSLF